MISKGSRYGDVAFQPRVWSTQKSTMIFWMASLIVSYILIVSTPDVGDRSKKAGADTERENNDPEIVHIPSVDEMNVVLEESSILLPVSVMEEQCKMRLPTRVVNALSRKLGSGITAVLRTGHVIAFSASCFGSCALFSGLH